VTRAEEDEKAFRARVEKRQNSLEALIQFCGAPQLFALDKETWTKLARTVGLPDSARAAVIEMLTIARPHRSAKATHKEKRALKKLATDMENVRKRLRRELCRSRRVLILWG
jgi:hypothetical protein